MVDIGIFFLDVSFLKDLGFITFVHQWISCDAILGPNNERSAIIVDSICSSYDGTSAFLA